MMCTTSCFTNHMFRLQQFLLHFSCRYIGWLLIFQGGGAKYDSCPRAPNTLATTLTTKEHLEPFRYNMLGLELFIEGFHYSDKFPITPISWNKIPYFSL